MFKQYYLSNFVILLSTFWCISFLGITTLAKAQNATGAMTKELSEELAKVSSYKDSFDIYIIEGDKWAQVPTHQDNAIQYYQEALALSKRNKRPQQIIVSHSRMHLLYFRKGDNADTEMHLEKAILDAQVYESEYPKGLGIIYRTYHVYAYYKADYAKMLECGNLALSYLLKVDDDKLLSFAYIDIGNAYYYLGDYQNALSNYLHSAKLYEAGKNNSYQVYGNIADVHIILNQTDKAEEVLQKFLKATNNEKSSAEHDQKICIIYYKLSKVASLKEDHETSLSYALQSIDANAGRFKSELIFANNYASTALSHLNRFQEALDYAFRASQLLKEFPDIGLEAEIENSIGNLYVEMGEDLEAQKHFEKSLDIAQNKGFVHLEMRSALELSKIQNQIGDYKKAFANLDKYISIKDSLFTIEKDQNVSELQTKYDTEKKEIENANLKRTNELVQARNQKYLIGGMILAGVLLLLAIFYMQLQRVKNQLAIQNDIVAQKNNELTELDKIKSNFFANVSHELRTPLTLILGPLSRLLKSENIDNTEIAMLKLMEQNGGNLLQLINEILDLSKIEANKLELHERPIVLYLFVQRLLANFESLATRKNINLVFEFKANSSLQINVDTNKLAKIINNLVSNACKFTPSGGNVVIKIEDRGHQLEFEVSDTGNGIHQDDLPHIFNRFYQSKQTDAQAEGGTGIGLALVNEFVKLFGGTISVKSELKEGSVFNFLIPKKEVVKPMETEDVMAIETLEDDQTMVSAKDKPIDLEENEITIGDDSDKAIVLIVEDNYHLREYIQLILGSYYNTIIAENGQMALDWLNAMETDQTPDIIISDVMMPVMDGIELLSHLKRQERFSEIPIVMLTAKASMESKIEALRIGVDDYMIKPFVEEELLARVENLLKHGFARRQYLESTLVEEQTDNPVVEIIDQSKGVLEDESRSQKDLDWLADVEDQVLKSYTDFEFNLERLSEMVFLSPRQTRRRLKELTGLSFSHYIREVRLTEARRMLENDEVHAIKQLAYKVGLKDVKYFSQQFKKRFGKSPSAYLNV